MKIRARLEDLKERRTSKQPLEYPSAGEHLQEAGGLLCRQADTGMRACGASA